ncbi:hypothetical protein NMY22_g17690 [Coprinellus aureogranulatus]|nr:hypothetical protein NMY22_g17690 [Coprinellus aureogranulatus]
MLLTVPGISQTPAAKDGLSSWCGQIEHQAVSSEKSSNAIEGGIVDESVSAVVAQFNEPAVAGKHTRMEPAGGWGVEQERQERFLDAAIGFSHHFDEALGIVSFNPHGGEVSRDVAILLNLGSAANRGITRTEFRQIMRRCAECGSVCFKERQEFHRCNIGRMSRAWKGRVGELVDYLLSSVRNPGLSRNDLRTQFVCCGLCHRICMARTFVGILHDCSTRNTYSIGNSN